MLKEQMTIDTEYGMAYVYFAAGDVARTEMVHPAVNIDVNKDGEIYGVEFLNTKALTFTDDLELDCPPHLKEHFISAILAAQRKVLAA
jgi:uncharacterized protein YuzE